MEERTRLVSDDDLRPEEPTAAEEPARPAGPAEREAHPVADDPGDRAPEPADGELADTEDVLARMVERLGRVEEQTAEFHRRSAHRETVIDRLHEENQRLRGGVGRAVLQPVVADLIRLYDQLDREARRLGEGESTGALFLSFADDVSQILDRCGFEVFTAEVGEPFQHDRHRPLAVVPCTDETLHNTVAEAAAVGFAERETGRVRRPAQARFHQYDPQVRLDEPGDPEGTVR
ncbi:MAG: nucleotide exchange factor GrpE [Actinoallomurus sp.]